MHLSAEGSLCSQLKPGNSMIFFSTLYFSSVFTNVLTLQWKLFSDQGSPAIFSPFRLVEAVVLLGSHQIYCKISN